MSYAMASVLQKAVFGVLSVDSSVQALSGGAVYDALPEGAVPGLFVLVGEEEVRDRSTQTGAMAAHRLVVSVVSEASGFRAAKDLAAAVSDALSGTAPVLDRGRIVNLSFLRARARRVRAGQTRRIDLTFRAIVADD